MFNELNTLSLFFEQPQRKFHLREIARLLNINPVTAKTRLKPFVEQLILKLTKEKGFFFYKSNVESVQFKKMKQIFNIEKVHSSGLIKYLEDKLNFPCVILFGSWARSENTSKSDIDLFVINESKKELKLEKYEKILKTDIQLFIRTRKELEQMKIKNKELLNNIINGIILTGYFEVF